MIVLDASATLEILLNTPRGTGLQERILRGRESLHAPHLLDLEVAQVLRRYVRAGEMTAGRGLAAIEDLDGLRLTRHPHTPMLPRVWHLRDGLTAYDAVYVALAEVLGARLVTSDTRLARSRGHRAEIEVV